MSTRESLKAAPTLVGAALALALLAAAGCESSTKGSSSPLTPPGSPQSDSPGSATAGSSTPGAASSPPAASTSAAPLPADGTRVAACADGRCEVSVGAGTAIPIPERTGLTKLKLTKVAGNRATFTMEVIRTDGGYSSSGTCSGTYCNTSSDNGVVTLTMGPDSHAVENHLSLQTQTISDRVVVKVAPA